MKLLWKYIYFNHILQPNVWLECTPVDLETHHGDDVGDAVSAVDDGARQRPLSHLSGRPGGC